MFKTIIKYSTLLVVVLLLTLRCATVGYPAGGPKDSIPPRLMGTYPMPYAVNFDGKKVVLLFNEYVQLKDQSKLFVMSPPATKKPTLTIRGKSVIVEFQESLDSNATYRLDFGSSIVDNNEGNKLDGFSFVFSTGPHIDSLVMTGQSIDAFTRDTVVGAFLFYFDAKQDSMKLDSTMFKSRAEALFRTDSSGYFVADILKEKPYRVYAMADDNGNQLYEAGTDMIGFLDSTYNPVDLPDFTMVFDSIKNCWELDKPQVMFEMFKEIPVKRQTLLEHKRTERLKMHIVFNAPNTVIDTLKFDSLPDNWIQKHWNPTKDTLSMWIAPPSVKQLEQLPDTLKARIAFQKHDSLWNFYTHGQDLSFNFKTDKPKPKKVVEPETQTAKIKKAPKRKRRKINPQRDSIQLAKKQLADSISREKQRKDSLENAAKMVNPFKLEVNARKEFVPLGDILFSFNSPLSSVAKERITLDRKPLVSEKKGGRNKGHAATEKYKEPFEFFQDTIIPTRWHLRAKWKSGDTYELLIPDSTFRDINFYANDTLKAEFTAMMPEEFGTVIIKQKPDSLYQGQYIVQVVSGKGKDAKIVRQQIIDPSNTQPVRMEYLEKGSYRLRVIEDANKNDRWDTGALTLRQKPERVRIWRSTSGDTEVVSKENWEVPIELNYVELFAKP